jgi:hypothetical protein
MVARYRSPCGHTFSKKEAAERHEKRSFCWKLPALKTCITCSSRRIVELGSGEPGDDRGKGNECANPKMDRDDPELFTAISPKVPDVAVNCKLWSPK